MDAQSYLRWDQIQDKRHEFEDGEVRAMPHGSARHNALAARLAALLATPVGGECSAFGQGQRIAVVPGSRYYYTDASLVCGAVEMEPGTDAMRNPSALIEVLSPETEARDRGDKWIAYRQLASLRDYLLVSQERVAVEHYRRGAHRVWHYAVHDAGDSITLASGHMLRVDALYDGIWLPVPDDARVELIDGVLVPKADPSPRHSRAQGAIGSFIGVPFDVDEGWWILPEIDVAFPPNVYRPDLAGWRRSRLPDPAIADPVEVVPDWCCEILSPSNADRDRVRKRRDYAAHGVRWYWLVDPEARVIESLELDGRIWRECGAWGADDRDARIPPFDAVPLEVSRVFLPRGG